MFGAIIALGALLALNKLDRAPSRKHSTSESFSLPKSGLVREQSVSTEAKEAIPSPESEARLLARSNRIAKIKSLQTQPQPRLETQPTIQKEKLPAITPVSTPKKSKELSDPAARVALAYVGVDPAAEAYWLDSIFDTSLSDDEREDLMEDLNEEGFDDPKNPTEDDVPLILSRMAIIEEVAPWTDDFMAEHLGEAYKDLSNMLAGRGPQ